MGHERVQRIGHVGVSQVPRRDAPLKHGAVILLGVEDEARVLLGLEIIVLRHPSVPGGVLGGAAAELHELRHHLLFAGLAESESRRIAVGLHVLPEMVEAGVALPGPPRGGGVHGVEVTEDRLHGGVQAIEVEAVEPRRPIALAFVVRAEPAHEVQDVGVAPHPGRKAPETRQRLGCVAVFAASPHVAVHPPGVGPVAFDRHRPEPLFGQQPFRDLGPHPVELVGAVGSFADQNEVRLADGGQQRLEVLPGAQREGRLPNDVDVGVGESRVADAAHDDYRLIVMQEKCRGQAREMPKARPIPAGAGPTS